MEKIRVFIFVVVILIVAFIPLFSAIQSGFDTTGDFYQQIEN